MTQRINYSQANNSGKMLAQAINEFLEAKAKFERTAAMLDAFASDWTAMSGELGITTQEASDTWFVVAAVRDAFSSANAGDMKGKLGSLSRLDQG